MNQEAILIGIITATTLTIGHFYFLTKERREKNKEITRLKITLARQEDYVIDIESELHKTNELLNEILIIFRTKNETEKETRINIVQQKIKELKKYDRSEPINE